MVRTENSGIFVICSDLQWILTRGFATGVPEPTIYLVAHLSWGDGMKVTYKEVWKTWLSLGRYRNDKGYMSFCEEYRVSGWFLHFRYTTELLWFYVTVQLIEYASVNWLGLGEPFSGEVYHIPGQRHSLSSFDAWGSVSDARNDNDPCESNKCRFRGNWLVSCQCLSQKKSVRYAK